MRAAKFRIDRFGELQLATLNSATKYPSIPTYHILGQRGRLTEERSTEFPGEVEVTEKIDGANARIILPPPEMGTPLIGSRSELLHSVGDVIANAAQGIVAATRTLAFQLTGVSTHPDALTVLFGEVYGGATTKAGKNYSTTAVGFRLFDVAEVPLDVLYETASDAAEWRDRGGQWFLPTRRLRSLAEQLGVDTVPVLDVPPPPVSVSDTHRWLTETIAETHARIDETGRGRPEGVVVRVPDRSLISKIRFEDYERTEKAGMTTTSVLVI